MSSGNITGVLQQGTVGGPLSEFLETFGLGAELAAAIASGTVFLLVVAVTYVGAKLFLLPLFSRLLESRGLEAHARRPLQKGMLLVVVFVGIAVGFGMAGYGNFLQSLATVAAAATLAIGFALQNVIQNFVAGVFIFTDKPFRIGDWIEWDGNSGVVEDISFRVSRVRTFDNELLTVPNSQLTDGVIKNPVAKDTLRVKFTFGISYDDDIDRATEIIIEEAERHADILEDPGPSVRLTELADSYVGLQSRVWISNPSRADFLKTRAEYVKSVKQRFDAEGIEIPFPQRDLSGDLVMTGTAELAEATGD